MKKSELVSAVRDACYIHSLAEAERILNGVFLVILDELKNGNGEVVLPLKMGKFKTEKRAKRVGMNPRTGHQITIPECRIVKFVMSAELKRQLNFNADI